MDQITLEELKRICPGASESTLRVNAGNIQVQNMLKAARGDITVPKAAPAPIRIRQSTKPDLNKTEARGIAFLQRRYPDALLRVHAKTYVLANGVRYTPEATAILDGVEHAWEVKGPKIWDDATVKIKVAANEFPEIVWTMIWEDSKTKEWKTQIILARI